MQNMSPQSISQPVLGKPLAPATSLAPAMFHTPSTLPTTAPKEADYPNVRFWHRVAWKKYADENDGVSNFDSDEDDPRTPPYLETEEGVPVTKSRLKYMRRIARELWNEFKGNGVAPPSWTKLSHSAAEYFYQEMYKKFPELRLCSHNWKLDQLAIKSYPAWYKNRLEPKTEKSDGETKGRGKKRAGTSSRVGKAKQVKLGKQKCIPDDVDDSDSPSDNLGEITAMIDRPRPKVCSPDYHVHVSLFSRVNSLSRSQIRWQNRGSILRNTPQSHPNRHSIKDLPLHRLTKPNWIFSQLLLRILLVVCLVFSVYIFSIIFHSCCHGATYRRLY
jgi:hypothetical protein